MPVVHLKGHDFIYPVSDILRLFYGEARESNGSVSAGNDETVICSEYNGSFVRTACGEIYYEKQTDGDNKTENFPPKREVKRQLYKVLSELTGKTFPWGSLTGMRPTLIAQECGFDAQLLSDIYFPDKSKARLAVETAQREKNIIDSIGPDKVHLYISVPICPTRCDYCSFPTSVLSAAKDVLEGYVDTLVNELKIFHEFTDPGVGSIYIGGGTPTVLPDHLFEKLLYHVYSSYDIAHIPEYTVEAGRPETISDSKIALMKKYGVTRVCVNPQTFNEETLTRIGRAHNNRDTFEAFKKVRSAGFRTISMDLIAGLEGETKNDFLHSLETTVDLLPENITIHSLSLKRNSIMEKRYSDSPGTDPVIEFVACEGDIAEMLKDSYNTLASNSYKPYYMYRQKYTLGGNENTGYTLEGHECLYNCAMMGDRHTIIGVGAKAISKRVMAKSNNAMNLKNIKTERYPDPADISAYIRNSALTFEKKREFFYESTGNI